MSDKTREELEAEIKALKAKVAKANPAYDAYEAGVEVTVGVLACNAWQYLGHILPRLHGQGLRMDVLTYTDSASIDCTHEMLGSAKTKSWMETHKNKSIREYRYLGELPHRPMEQILAWSKGNFVAEAKTPYLFFLDADVALPPGAIKHALEELKADPEAGVIGVPYDYDTDHVEQGAIIMSRELAEKTKFWHEPRCVCTSLAKSVHEIGLKMRHWERPEMARHVKWTGGIAFDALGGE